MQIKSLRIAFFGTTNFAAYHLNHLIHHSLHQIVAIFTQTIKLSNRTSSYLSVVEIAKKNNLLLFESNYLSMSDIITITAKMNLDLIIVVSYGLILPEKILNLPKFGCINVHGSLLPRWRGPAPIQRALEHGDSITGISIIKMNQGIDTGNILFRRICDILPKDTSISLSNRLAYIGSSALLHILTQISLLTHSFFQKSIPQNKLYVTYAHKLNKQEGHINWNLSAIQIERNIRAFNPWPVSYFYIKQHRIRVWNAEINYNITHYSSLFIIPGTILSTDLSGVHIMTGSGILTLTVLQLSGKKKISTQNIINSYKKLFTPNTILL